MSKFTHISSFYRNRNQFPNQAEFVLTVSQSGNETDPNFAKDPVIASYPILYFDRTEVFFAGGPFTGGTHVEPILSAPPAIPSGYPIGDDFYAGVLITDTTMTPNETCMITSYNSTTYQITIEPSFSDTWQVTDNYTLSYPSYVSDSNIVIHSGTNNTGAYEGYYLEAHNLGELRRITNYNGQTRLATVDVAFSNDLELSFSLRSAHPYIYHQQVVSIGTYTYLGTTYQYVQLATTTPNVEDLYTSSYFFDKELYVGAVTPNYSLIVKYWGTPPVGSGLPNNVALLKTSIPLLAPLQRYDILGFTRDNHTPITIVESLTQEIACYEIELVSLILPNVDIISTSGGGRTVNIPFIYVELSNYTPNFYHVIHSNNPNTNRALFLVNLSDYPSIYNSPFVRVDGGTQIQVLKFKNNDTLKFKIYLPNGELFKTLKQDNVSPLPPNNSLQIDMEVKIRRL